MRDGPLKTEAFPVATQPRLRERFHLLPPDGRDLTPLDQANTTERVRRRDLLGGLIHEYRAAA
jgi:hypothetical protein